MFSKTSLENQLLRWDNFLCSHPDDVKAYIQRGMVHFKLAHIAESIADFDQAEKLDPKVTPYLWQRGLSYYYAERFAEGAKQFEIDLTVNSQDVEETVWRYLCIARLEGMEAAKNSLLIVRNDPRQVMQSVYQFFAGDGTIDDVIATGKQQGKRGQFYSHLYLGLYYEVAADVERSRDYIIKAVADNQLEDYMWYLALVHKILRDY